MNVNQLAAEIRDVPAEREVSVSFDIREWAEEYVQAEWDALGTAIAGEREEWLGAVARGEGAAFNRVREAAEQEGGRSLSAGEAQIIGEVARAMLEAA